jgi:hypothetical protein
MIFPYCIKIIPNKNGMVYSVLEYTQAFFANSKCP